MEPSQLRRWDLGDSGEGGLPDAEMITLQVEEARGRWAMCWRCMFTCIFNRYGEALFLYAKCNQYVCSAGRFFLLVGVRLSCRPAPLPPVRDSV
jgi:hypothetical protein